MATCELGGVVKERERRDGAGRVVRVVQPQDRRAVPRVGADTVEVGQEVRRREREPHHVAPGEPRAPLGDGVAGRRHHDEIASRCRIEHRLCQREDRLLAAERGDHVRGRVQRRAEPPRGPRDDRLAQLGEARGARVRRRRDDRLPQGVADERRRFVARVADAEVDQLAPGVERLSACAGRAPRTGTARRLGSPVTAASTLPPRAARNPRSTSNERTSAAVSTRSSSR